MNCWYKIGASFQSNYLHFFNIQILFDVPLSLLILSGNLLYKATPKKNVIDVSTKNNLFKIIDMSFSSRRKILKII